MSLWIAYRQPRHIGLVEQLFELAVEFQDMGDKQSAYTADDIKFRYFLLFPVNQYNLQAFGEFTIGVRQPLVPLSSVVSLMRLFLVGLRKVNAKWSRMGYSGGRGR
jgi:hypothetical protein